MFLIQRRLSNTAVKRLNLYKTNYNYSSSSYLKCKETEVQPYDIVTVKMPTMMDSARGSIDKWIVEVGTPVEVHQTRMTRHSLYIHAIT